MYDTDFREAPCAAVDTAYRLTQKGALTPGAYVVPMTARQITAIRIFVSGIATDVVTGSTTGIHVMGGGVKGIGDGWFPGPLLSISGAAATSGGFEYADAQVYKTAIPVTPGGQIDIDAFIHGEDPGTAHVLVELEYDGIPGVVKDCDYREIDIGAAANTPVAMVDRGAVANEGNFKPAGRRIVEIVFGAALDPTGDAANGLNFAPAVQLSGNGLMTNGNYSIVGPSGPTQPDTDVSGNQGTLIPLSRRQCGAGIATQSNGEIQAAAQNIESINPGHAIIGLCYG